MALEQSEKDLGDYIHKSQVSVHMIWIVTVFMTCCFTATKVLPCCNLFLAFILYVPCAHGGYVSVSWHPAGSLHFLALLVMSLWTPAAMPKAF